MKGELQTITWEWRSWGLEIIWLYYWYQSP